MLRYLRRLVDHLAWANERALASLRETADEDGLRLLAHLLATEKVWLARIRAGDSSGMEIWPELTLEGCEELMEENVAGYRDLLGELPEEDLSGKVAYENSRGVGFRTPVVEILLHVFVHGAHHRGQIARRVRAAGREPMNTDVITFVREHPLDDPEGS